MSLLLVALGAPVAAADPRLDAPHPIDWRGVPLREVLNQLSAELGVPYLTDGAVPAATMDRRIRLLAGHLSGRQAFRWAARLAGLEAVFREDLLLIAPSDQLPLLWRLTGGATAEDPGSVERLKALSERRSAVAWIDTPLSGVGRDISTQFAIDAIFHPDFLSDEPLIHLEQADVDLAGIRAAIESQLKAQTILYDGALWVVPAGMASDLPASRPSPAATAPSSGIQPVPTAGPLDQLVILDRSVRSWRDFCDRLSQAGEIACRSAAPGSPFGSPMEARGTLGDILTSARLLGRLTWGLVPVRESGVLTLEIRPPAGKR